MPFDFLSNSEKNREDFNQIILNNVGEVTDREYLKSSSKELEYYKKDSFFKAFENIKQMNFDSVLNFGDKSHELVLKNYLHDIFPSTQVLLNMKLDKENRMVSISEYMKFLANFKVYYNDLNVKHYLTLQDKLRENIKKKMESSFYKSLKRFKRYEKTFDGVENKIFSPLGNIFSTDEDFSNIMELYDLKKKRVQQF